MRWVWLPRDTLARWIADSDSIWSENTAYVVNEGIVEWRRSGSLRILESCDANAGGSLPLSLSTRRRWVGNVAEEKKYTLLHGW